MKSKYFDISGITYTSLNVNPKFFYRALFFSIGMSTINTTIEF